MIRQSAPTLAELYEADETAWLEAMAELLLQDRRDALDYAHLAEYLADMAMRDRREVESRLVVYLVHALKWIYQPERRSNSWRATLVEQRQELVRHASRGVLRSHATAVLSEVYVEAVERAAAETGLPVNTFPSACPYTLDQLLSPDLLQE